MRFFVTGWSWVFQDSKYKVAFSLVQLTWCILGTRTSATQSALIRLFYSLNHLKMMIIDCKRLKGKAVSKDSSTNQNRDDCWQYLAETSKPSNTRAFESYLHATSKSKHRLPISRSPQDFHTPPRSYICLAYIDGWQRLCIASLLQKIFSILCVSNKLCGIFSAGDGLAIQKLAHHRLGISPAFSFRSMEELGFVLE